MSNFPEHDRLELVSDKSQAIGDFIMVFLPGKGIYLSTMGFDDHLLPNLTPIEDLLAEFFQIDQQKLEQEKQEMLREMRENN